MNWKDCKKCPESLCQELPSGVNKCLVSGQNFNLWLGCNNTDFDVTFKNYSTLNTEVKCNSLEEAITVLLQWENIQLEDTLVLLKLKSTL